MNAIMIYFSTIMALHINYYSVTSLTSVSTTSGLVLKVNCLCLVCLLTLIFSTSSPFLVKIKKITAKYTVAISINTKPALVKSVCQFKNSNIAVSACFKKVFSKFPFTGLNKMTPKTENTNPTNNTKPPIE